MPRIYGTMSDDDLRKIFEFLKTVPAKGEKTKNQLKNLLEDRTCYGLRGVSGISTGIRSYGVLNPETYPRSGSGGKSIPNTREKSVR